MGPTAATWRPVEGKHAAIFGTDDSGTTMMDSNMNSGELNIDADLSATTNALRNATITKATLLQSYNSFPVPLGVTVNCLPCNKVVDVGDKYTFTTIPNMSVNIPNMLYEAGESQGQAKVCVAPQKLLISDNYDLNTLITILTR